MKETEIRKKREREFTLKHTMTEEDRRKLIDDKLKRAREYSEAWRKREALLAESR